MKKLFLVFALALVVGLSSASASDWTYSFTSTHISGSGSLTANLYAADTYHAATAGGFITSGIYAGAALSLIPGGPGVSTAAGFNYDNLFFYPPTGNDPDNYLGTNGLLFAFHSGVNDYALNVWGNGPGGISGHNYSVWTSTGGGYTLTDSNVAAFAVSPSAVPEPGFYGVLALGLSGLFVGVRRRRRA